MGCFVFGFNGGFGGGVGFGWFGGFGGVWGSWSIGVWSFCSFGRLSGDFVSGNFEGVNVIIFFGDDCYLCVNLYIFVFVVVYDFYYDVVFLGFYIYGCFVGFDFEEYIVGLEFFVFFNFLVCNVVFGYGRGEGGYGEVLSCKGGG